MEQTLALQQIGLIQAKAEPAYFVRFENFPYDDWKPARQRYDFVNAHVKGNSLLDIGCGYYPITEEVNVERKVGIDVSRRAAEKAKKDFHQFYFIDITQTDKDLLRSQLGTFDTVVASEVLEHLENPGATIDKVAYLLNPRGRFIVTVPNGNSLAGNIDKLRNNGEYNRFKLYHRTHISLLKTQKWEALFKNAGLEVIAFDFRPSDLVEGFPRETTPGWKTFCRLAPNYFAHQYFYVLEKPENKFLEEAK